jgi:hypothetical protein
MKRMRPLALCLALLPPLPAVAGETARYAEQKIEVARKRAALLFGRFDADARKDLLIAGESDVALQLQDAKGGFGEPIALALGQELGGGALIDVADLDKDGVDELVALHRTGVDRFRFDAKARRFVRMQPALIEKQRGIPFLHLVREEFMYDVDADGDRDIAFPVNGRVFVYTQDETGTFARSGEVETQRAEVQVRSGAPHLGSALVSRIQIPRLRIQKRAAQSVLELKLGDGRTLRSNEGSSVLAGEYSIAAGGADPLAKFKQRHGIELKNNESLQAIVDDLDRDGDGDYTIVYQNRIWVYRGSPEGFDFERAPDQLVKVSAADRVSALLLPLDADEKPDLVLFKYQVPSVARIVAALAIGLRSEIEVIGYPNDGDPVFSRRPAYRSTFVVRVPPLLQLIGELEELVERFRQVMRPLQGLTSGDFNGDGRDDVLRLVGDQMEIYPSRADDPPLIDLASASNRDLLTKFELYKLVQRILFEKPRRDVSIDGAMTLANEVVSTMQGAITLGREPSQRVAVPAEAAKRVDQILTQDLDGDARDDIILYVEPDLEPKAGVPLPEKQTLLLWYSQASKVAAPVVTPPLPSTGSGDGAASGPAAPPAPRKAARPAPARVPAPRAARDSS